MHNTLKRKTGFTLTELSVLMGVGTILASVLVADLTQTRAKLLQQACAANMKHWGMAISMYMDDYNGVIYYDAGFIHFTDAGSPLQRYFGTSSNSTAALATMRSCPARTGLVPSGLEKGYEIVVGQSRKGLSYQQASTGGSPYFRGVPPSYWPDLKSVPQPAQYLLMTECYNTVACGVLVNRLSQPAIGFGLDPLPPLARHGNAVNCLFGDFHVELVSAQTISNHDLNCNVPGNVWFDLD